MYPDLHSLNRTAAEESAGLIQETLRKSGRFNLVVAIDDRDVGLDVPCQQPRQKLSTAVGLVGF